MASNDNLTAEEREFLAKCEEELKHRFTDKDEEFMKVFNAEPSVPPIVESWWVPNNNQGRRNDRRHNQRYNPYERQGNRDNYNRRGRDHQDRRGYSDHNDREEDRDHGGYRKRPRHY